RADLGRLSAARRDEWARVEQRARRAHPAVRPFLDRLYRPTAALSAPDDSVMICRCESIRASELREVAAGGWPGPNQAKAFLRCGMGPCQGRLCGPTVASVMAQVADRGMDEVGYYRVRSPLKPVTVGDLASRLVDREQETD